MRFVAGVTVGSRNTCYRAARCGLTEASLPPAGLHQLSLAPSEIQARLAHAGTFARCAILAIVDLEQFVMAWIMFQDFPSASMVAMPALRSTFSARP